MRENVFFCFPVQKILNFKLINVQIRSAFLIASKGMCFRSKINTKKLQNLTQFFSWNFDFVQEKYCVKKYKIFRLNFLSSTTQALFLHIYNPASSNIRAASGSNRICYNFGNSIWNYNDGIPPPSPNDWNARKKFAPKIYPHYRLATSQWLCRLFNDLRRVPRAAVWSGQ